MKRFLIVIFALLALSAQAQTARRIYVSGGRVVAVNPIDTTRKITYSPLVTFKAENGKFKILLGSVEVQSLAPADFLNKSGQPYGNTAQAAFDAFVASGATTSSGGSATIDTTGLVQKIAGKGLSTNDYSSTEKTKLAGIAANATVNSSDATLLNRSNHTGTQPYTTITGLGTASTQNVDNFQGTGIYSTGSAGRLAVGTTSAGKQLNVHQVAGSAKGFLLSGDEYYSSGNGDANGILFIAGVNRSGNRQLWLGDNTALGSSVNGFFRYATGTPMPSIDACVGTGAARLNLNIGTPTSNVGIGFEYTGSTGTTLPASRLTVYGNAAIGNSYIGVAAPANGAIIQGRVGIGTSAPAAMAALDITSTSQGVLFPRLTSTQRDAIATPIEGLQVYNTTTHSVDVYMGSAWKAMIQDTTDRASKAALNGKQPTLVSGTTIKTINGVAILGSGDITISGGGGAPANGITYVFTKTRQGIVDAIAATAAGGRIELLPGTYNFDTGDRNPILIQKSISIVGQPGSTTLNGGTSNGSMFLINGCSNVLLQDFALVSNKVTGSPFESLILVNEEAVVSGLTLRRLFFSCPAGDFNAFSTYCYSANTNTGVDHNNFTFDQCEFYQCGKMAIEIHNDSFSGVYRGRNLRFLNCRFEDLGRNMKEGMAISLSGEMQDVLIESPYILGCRWYGIECVATKNVTINNAFIKTTKTIPDGGGTNGYNITDGGHTDGGSAGHNPKDIIISGGVIDVNGQPVQYYWGGAITFNGGYWKGKSYCTFQHGKDVNIFNVNFDLASTNGKAQNILSFEDVQNGLIQGGSFSRVNSTQGPYYQTINLENNSTGWTISNVKISTNGNSDNFNSTYPDLNNNYISGGSVFQNNMWKDIFWNNKKAPDYVGGSTSYTFNNVSTTAGVSQQLALTIYTGTGIDRIVGYENGTRVSVDIPFDVSSITNSSVTIQPAATTTYSKIYVITHPL